MSGILRQARGDRLASRALGVAQHLGNKTGVKGELA